MTKVCPKKKSENRDRYTDNASNIMFYKLIAPNIRKKRLYTTYGKG